LLGRKALIEIRVTILIFIGYSFFDLSNLIQLGVAVENDASSSEEEEDLVAGIFQTRKNKLSKKKNALHHSRDCSKDVVEKDAFDVAIDEIKELIKDCFVTGKWAESENAERLLEEDEGKYFYKNFTHS